MRIPYKLIPKQLLYGKLAEGKRSHGGQKKRFKDCLKVSLKAFDIDIASWETLAQDRSSWHSAIQKGSQTDEVRRTAEAQKKRELRKTRAASTGSCAPTHGCPTCANTFCAQIGLISYLRTHRTVNYPGMPMVLINYDGRMTDDEILIKELVGAG